MPWLAGLVCCSPFDLAVHDAYGQLHGCPTYETYHAGFMNRDLSCYLQPALQCDISFQGKYPEDFLIAHRPDSLVAWHLVGGLDLLEESELTGQEPNDGYHVLLEDWIERDGLKRRKVKLRGNDADWDYVRLVKVVSIGLTNGLDWLSPYFNCPLTDP